MPYVGVDLIEADNLVKILYKSWASDKKGDEKKNQEIGWRGAKILAKCFLNSVAKGGKTSCR